MNTYIKSKTAVIYARLSSEDNIKDVSQSINNQISICKEYAKNNNLIISNVYYDDGYTGTNFNRPGFKQLIKDIENKKVKIIITKDLSRLGRNFIQTSYYIEDYFIEKKIRYISVNDNYDTENENDVASLPIKNFINSMYAKECSKKQQLYRCKYADKKYFAVDGVYGFIKENGTLIIDKSVEHIIKLIYQKYLNNEKVVDIIRYLKANEIPCPSYHKQYELNSKLTYKTPNGKYGWTRTSIDNILSERQYTGALVNLKEKYNLKTKKMEKNYNPVIVENHHEAIIDIDTFNNVQELKKSRNHKSNVDDSMRLYKFFYDENGNVFSYYHHIRKDTGKLREEYKCNKTKKAFKASLAHDVIYNDVIKVFKILTSNPPIFIDAYIEKINKRINKNNLESLNKQKNDLDKKVKALLEQYVSEEITETTYINKLRDINEKLIKINNSISNVQIENSLLKNKSKEIITFINSLSCVNDELSKLNLIRLLVTKVIVAFNNRKGIDFEIVYKFNI